MTRRRLGGWFVLALVALAAGAGLAAGDAGAGRGGASGTGANLGAPAAETSVASSGAVERRAVAADAVTGPAGAVGRVEIHVKAGGALGEASASARDILLLGGRVAIGGLQMRVVADAHPGGASQGIASYAGDRVSVDGQDVQPSPGTRVEVPGAGTLVFFDEVVDGEGSTSADALRLDITDPASGLPAGTSVVVGHVEARASAPSASAPAARPKPAPGSQPPVSEGGGGDNVPPAVAPAPLPQLAPVPGPLGLPRRVPPVAGVPTEGSDYVFPVYGPDTSFSDDYGAPRAGTGWHHGNDVFAPTGTPLVAVAAGILSRVGVNTLGGNRLWLTDGRGNGFYYAHLSAFAPGVVDGTRVAAGQVIGFVGNSGQAISTPSHLHFEVHPGGGDSVDPYPYLLAWQRHTDVSRAFEAATVAQGQAPASGALLVGAEPAVDTPPANQGDGTAQAVP